MSTELFFDFTLAVTEHVISWLRCRASSERQTSFTFSLVLYYFTFLLWRHRPCILNMIAFTLRNTCNVLYFILILTLSWKL